VSNFRLVYRRSRELGAWRNLDVADVRVNPLWHCDETCLWKAYTYLQAGSLKIDVSEPKI
jgi:hypothetical protein